jgi:uncharacterized membrane protein (UPF0127 family)
MRGVAVLLLVALASCGREAHDPARLQTTMLVIRADSGSVTLEVEVADEASERETGLMGRRSLPEEGGMAFLWPGPVRATFWMKDTLIPLSIAFWGENGDIVSILDMDPCRADPCPTYDPGVAFVGALEVNQGFFDTHGVAVGDVVEGGTFS